MPPPKKPKSGVTRVEEFLSASELEALRCSQSASPDSSANNQHEQVPKRDNKINRKYSNDLPAEDERDIKVNTEENKENKVENNNSNDSEKGEHENEIETVSSKALDRSNVRSKGSDILQTLLQTPTAAQESMTASRDVKNNASSDVTATASSSECGSLSTLSEMDTRSSVEENSSPESSRQEAGVSSNNIAKTESCLKNDYNVVYDYSSGKNKCERENRENKYNRAREDISDTNGVQNGGISKHSSGETRKFDSLMMRRKLESLMDVLRPVLPHESSALHGFTHRESTFPPSVHNGQRSTSRSSSDSNDQATKSLQQNAYSLNAKIEQQQHRPSIDRLSPPESRLGGGTGRKSAERTPPPLLPPPHLYVSHLQSTYGASREKFLEEMYRNRAAHHSFVSKKDDTSPHMAFKNGLPMLPKQAPIPPPSMLSIPAAFSSQSSSEMFRASHLHENIFSRQMIQDPLARLQMSGRPALPSLLFGAVQAYSAGSLALSSGKNRNDFSPASSSTTTADNVSNSGSSPSSPQQRLPPSPKAGNDRGGGGRSPSKPKFSQSQSKPREPVDMEYDSAIGAAINSVRSEACISSSHAPVSSSSSSCISSNNCGGSAVKPEHGSNQSSMSSSMGFGHDFMSMSNSGGGNSSLDGQAAAAGLNSAASKISSSTTDLPSSTMEEHLRRSVDDKGQVRRCQICSDNASGFHYGVWSCEGCKAFFKRSLQGPVDYVCPATNSCTIDKHRRKSCQACRLRKCVDMGMSRGSCRKERRSSGPRPLKHKANEFVGDGATPCKKNMKSPLSSLPGIPTIPEHNIPTYNSPPSNASCPPSMPPTHHLPHHHHHPHHHHPAVPTAAAQSPFSVAPPHSSYSSNHLPIPAAAAIGHHSNNITPSARSLNAYPGSQLAVISPFRTSSTSATTSSSVSGEAFSATARSASVMTPHYGAPVTSQLRNSMTSQISGTHPLVEHLLRIDPPARQSGHDSSKQDSELTIMSSVLRLCDMELVDIINWAKSIPGYTELELGDRIHLLECCWMEILLFGLIWRSMDKPEILFLSSDLQLDKDRLRTANFLNIGASILACVKQLRSLDLKQEEFVLLRCLILLNSDLGDLQNVEKIESLKARIMEALQYTVLERGGEGGVPQGAGMERLMRMLMVLPHTRQVAMQLIRHLMTKQVHSILPMFALLKEMVEAFVSVMGFEWPLPPISPATTPRHCIDPEVPKAHSPTR